MELLFFDEIFDSQSYIFGGAIILKLETADSTTIS